MLDWPIPWRGILKDLCKNPLAYCALNSLILFCSFNKAICLRVLPLFSGYL